ncbi:MAG: hypothetical protein RLZZ540_2007 [Bacteroidota bacterium]|jgi:hypothetical protein
MKKYYILAFTFLCLLIGHSSFGQTSSGDYTVDEMNEWLSEVFGRQVTSFSTDSNGYITSVDGPGEGGSFHDGYVGFETSGDGTGTFIWTPINTTSTNTNTGTTTETTTDTSTNTNSSTSYTSWVGFVDMSSYYSGSTSNNNSYGDCYSCNLYEESDSIIYPDTSDNNDTSNYTASSDNYYYQSDTKYYDIAYISDSNSTTSTNLNLKKVITQIEYQNAMINSINTGYKIFSNSNFNLVTSNGNTYNGKLTRFVSVLGGTDYYYFTPATNSSMFSTTNQYLIPASGNSYISHYNNSYGGGTFPQDTNGFPIGFYSMATNNNGVFTVYFPYDQGVNEGLTPYCEGCTKIEQINTTKYSQLQQLLTKIKPFVLNNPTILNYFSILSGYNSTEISNLLSEENLKKIVRITDLINNGNFPRGTTPNILFIRKDYVSGLQSGTYYGYNYSTTDMNGLSFFIMIDILHELIHYGRYWNNLPIEVNGSEAGHTFESWAFGHEKVNVYLATQIKGNYGWNF